METASKAQQTNVKNLTGGIKNKKNHQFKTEYSTPLINNLEIKELFRNKNKKKGVSIIDFINKIVQVLKEDLY